MISTALDKHGSVLRDDVPEALFPWWSFTKPVLAVLVLRAVKAGKLDLDAPFEGNRFTLLQILQQRSGLPDYRPLPAYKKAVEAGEAPWTADRMLSEANYPELAYEPGKRWLYSNVGYFLLRQLLERTHNAPLSDIMISEIFTPLRLNARLAETQDDFEKIHWGNANGYHPDWVYHGCIMGTSLDAARMMQALIGDKLLTETSRNLMLTQQMHGGPIPGRVWSEIGYGLGMMIGSTDKVGRVIGHAGCGPFCANQVCYFPDLPNQPTVATFVKGGNEAPAEYEAITIAMRHGVNPA